MDVVIAVLLDLQQQGELRKALGGERFQQKAVLLRKKKGPTKSQMMTQAVEKGVAHHDPALKWNERHTNG